MTPFNKPYIAGQELHYINDAVARGHLSGNGYYTKKCQQFFQDRYGFNKCLLTTSCTDALEMCAILLDIKSGDEVIMPSYTFVSTANAFVLRGAKIIFADSKPDHPNIDESKIESLISSRTKAIVVVHYAGVACNMEAIMALSQKYNLFVVEDAAQAVESYYNGRALGGIGHLSTFSFHETKNIQCGEGGMLVINDKRFEDRAEVIWEKGTNRSAFFKGEVDKYGWVDVGSSFLPSELNAAYLLAQLDKLKSIQESRLTHWNLYYKLLKPLGVEGFLSLPTMANEATNNAHLFYISVKDIGQRDCLIEYLRSKEFQLVFHYLPLHISPYYKEQYTGLDLPNSVAFAETLIRLPLFVTLSEDKIKEICFHIKLFFSE